MKEYEITSGLAGSKHKLVLGDDFVEYDRLRWLKRDILDFRHGARPIVWYRFVVGQEFSIGFRNKEENELRISFSSYFGSDRNLTLYARIVDDIWDYYHRDIVDRYKSNLEQGESITLQGITVSRSHITLPGAAPIEWKNVGMKEYMRYFALFDRCDPTVHARIDYDLYGTETLWSIVRQFLGIREE